MVQLQKNDTDVQLTVRNADNEFDSSIVSGVFIDSSVIMDFNPVVDSSVFNDANLINFINRNYYVVSDSGTIRSAQSSTASMSFKYEIAKCDDVEVVASLYYSDVYT